ncbi:MAG: acyl-CoA dehydrogenase family protein, partial [Pseudomonadota bacterium]|nr:acyl-CoA dehydrogenase family protein [Pseudomonadota bacterium]
MATETRRKPKAATAPPPDGDFYQLASTLPEPDRELLARARAFMTEKVAPIINGYWMRGEFPFDLVVPGYRELGVAGLSYQGYGCPGRSPVLDGFLALELARVDASIATFHGVHSGLAMGSIYLCGSEEQKQRWLPAMHRLEKIGAFGLTEPEVGSGVAGGLTTSARREAGSWVLDGEKKWIGNATFADVTVIWARDPDDRQVKGFLVEKGMPGFSADRMEGKIALRVVENARIRLEGCRVPEENRLQAATSFKDTAAVLRMTRAFVAWEAVGCAMGAYEHALAYATRRQQFGRPIGKFQMVQDLLVQMLGNVTASMCMVLRLSQLQEAGRLREEHASLAKAFCTAKARETVGLARELFGGNGILVENDVGRFVADAEAIYSYEGTRQINSLIVGR